MVGAQHAFGFSCGAAGVEHAGQVLAPSKYLVSRIRASDKMFVWQQAVVRYLAAWNERDAHRRLELVAKAWTEDGSYVDRVRQGHGHNEIDAMIATAQAHFPGYQLHLASGIETHHEYVRFSWIAGGTNEAPLYIKGTDVAVLAEDGRMRSVVGFVDAAPVPMST